MSNNLDAPILNMLNKWNGLQIEYIIIIKRYTNLHHFNVFVGQCERHLSNSIDYLSQTLKYDSMIIYHYMMIEL